MVSELTYSRVVCCLLIVTVMWFPLMIVWTLWVSDVGTCVLWILIGKRVLQPRIGLMLLKKAKLM